MPGGLVQPYRVGADMTLGLRVIKERGRNTVGGRAASAMRAAGVQLRAADTQLNRRGIATDCSVISSDASAGRATRKIGRAAASNA